MHSIPIYTERNWRLIRAMFPIGQYSKTRNRYRVYINLTSDGDKAVLEHLYRHSPWLYSMIQLYCTEGVIFVNKIKQL